MDRGRTNPFQGFTDMISEMARMRELGTRGYEPSQEERQRTHATAWVPTADIFARGQDLVIRVELAGVEEEDVDVTFSGGVLTVSGERRSDLEDDLEVSFYTRERFYGAFRRSMSLPEGVDADRINATFENGMLEISIGDAFATAAPEEPRRISIKGRSG